MALNMLAKARQRLLQLAAQATANSLQQGDAGDGCKTGRTVQTAQGGTPAGNFLASWAGPALLPTASTGTQLRSLAAVGQSTPCCLSRSGTLQHRRSAQNPFVLGVLNWPMGEHKGLTMQQTHAAESEVDNSIFACSTGWTGMVWWQASASACIPQRHDAAHLPLTHKQACVLEGICHMLETQPQHDTVHPPDRIAVLVHLQLL